MFTINWVFALSMCEGNDYYTIHGLWNNDSWCKAPAFNTTAIEPIEKDLLRAWKSCPRFNHTDKELWEHEWKKHGSCFGMTELEYFNTSVRLWYDFAALCDLFNGGAPNCYIGIHGVPPDEIDF